MKKTPLLFLFFAPFLTWAQAPTSDLLVNIHTATGTEMSALSADIGSLIYNVDEKMIFVSTTDGWKNLEEITTFVENSDGTYTYTYTDEKGITKILNVNPDGSETVVQSGNAITTITGSGTTASPYIITAKPATLTLNDDGTYTFSNGIDPDVSFELAANTPPAIVSSSDANGSCEEAFQQNQTRDIIITGENFDGATTVNIPGQVVNSVTVNSATEIVANVTAGTATGAFNIEVTNSSGTTSSLPNGFEIKEALTTYNYAVADMTLTTQMSYDGTTLTKTAGTGWNRSGYSTTYAIPASNEGYVEFYPSATNKYGMFGLDSNPAQSANYQTIDYAIYLVANATINVFENGANKGQKTTYAIGDKLQVKVACDGTVTYLKNSTVFYTSLTKATNDLYFDSSLYSTGSSINNISITY